MRGDDTHGAVIHENASDILIFLQTFSEVSREMENKDISANIFVFLKTLFKSFITFYFGYFGGIV